MYLTGVHQNMARDLLSSQLFQSSEYLKVFSGSCLHFKNFEIQLGGLETFGGIAFIIAR